MYTLKSTTKHQLANSRVQTFYDLLGRGAYASHSFISIIGTGTSYSRASFTSMSIFSLWAADMDMAIFPVNWNKNLVETQNYDNHCISIM